MHKNNILQDIYRLQRKYYYHKGKYLDHIHLYNNYFWYYHIYLLFLYIYNFESKRYHYSHIDI